MRHRDSIHDCTHHLERGCPIVRTFQPWKMTDWTGRSAGLAMTKDERRAQLEEIADAPDGARQIAAIFDHEAQLPEGVALPSPFIRAMIETILREEFPDQ
jgi:hypothetical protein